MKWGIILGPLFSWAALLGAKASQAPMEDFKIVLGMFVITLVANLSSAAVFRDSRRFLKAAISFSYIAHVVAILVSVFCFDFEHRVENLMWLPVVVIFFPFFASPTIWGVSWSMVQFLHRDSRSEDNH